MQSIQEILDPTYEAIFDGDIVPLVEENWPTQIEPKPLKKPEPDKCGTCTKHQRQHHASKYGWCQWNGSMLLITHEKCGKYSKRKESAW